MVKKIEKTINEMEKFVEIYKAGFKDGYIQNSVGKIDWQKIYRKCHKAFKARFLA